MSDGIFLPVSRAGVGVLYAVHQYMLNIAPGQLWAENNTRKINMLFGNILYDNLISIHIPIYNSDLIET